MATYYETLTSAVNEMADTGYVSAERLAWWQEQLRLAAEASLTSAQEMEQMLRQALANVYQRLVTNGQALKLHPGVDRFTLDMLQPKLRAELDRRILASADLIKLNKTEQVQKTLRRFSGWATSIPAGGGDVDKRELKAEIRKPLASLPFEERRVLIDQGAKLASSIHAVIAEDGGAIAAQWVHVHQRGYDGRPEHIKRDGEVFLIRDSWAHKGGLVKSDKYTDDIEQPAELPFCRCAYKYLYSLRRLPADMLTRKGQLALEEMRSAA